MAPRKIRPVAPATPEEQKQIRGAHARRKAFETANPERFQGVNDHGVGLHIAYREHGFEDDAVNSAGQKELPGLEHPDTVPVHRWEDMHPEERKHTLREAAKFGVTPASAGKAFGAQLDQSYLRAARNDYPHSSTAQFYSDRSPKEDGGHTPGSRLLTSAKENGVSFAQQTLANAITSPKQKFDRTNKTTGETTYPNDQLATAGIQHAEAKKPYTEARAPAGVGGFHGNVQRAAYAHGQTMDGVRMADVKNPSGSSAVGPKTGPYFNSWVDPHGSSQFFVSDVHSGGGGMAPHLSHEAEPYRDEHGQPITQKFTLANGTEKVGFKYQQSERESYLGIKGIHQLHDYVARQEIAKRGLQSLSGAQAAQWGEEQHQRGLRHEADEYPSKVVREEHHPGQGTLF